MRRRATGQFTFLVLCFFPAVSWAAGGGHGPAPHVWLGLAFILAMAKLGGELALRLKQPPVLGELVAGIILGNLGLVGVGGMHALAADPSIMFLAELGVILLLFEVGLESTVSEMKRVAPQSGLVAVIGVIAPMGAGFLVSWLMLSDQPHTLHLFVGATLCATSVGITARVLQDLNFMQRKESQIILGAAVIDDVLGLIILAVVSAIAVQGQMPPALELFKIIGLAIGFLIGALVIGMLVTPGVFRAASKLRAGGVLAALAIAFCLALSGLAAWAGLAAIVGAFAAGLVLDEVHVRPFGHHSAHDLSKLVAPIVAVLAPVFFVRTGMGVDLSIVGPDALLFAAALSAVAVFTKLIAGLGILGGGAGKGRGDGTGRADRLTVGIGMIPRGEVGLIFAAVGAGIVVDGHALIEPNAYAAIVLMVMITTIVAPPWLASRVNKIKAREDVPPPVAPAA